MLGICAIGFRSVVRSDILSERQAILASILMARPIGIDWLLGLSKIKTLIRQSVRVDGIQNKAAEPRRQ